MSLSAGAGHACAVLTTGQVHCWGVDGANGALGNGPLLGGITPTAVVDSVDAPLENVVEVTASLSGGCARSGSGQVWCWGSGSIAGVIFSQFARIVHPANASQISCERHCCLVSFGNALCWGVNSGGRLGNGLVSGLQLTPAAVVTQDSTPLSGVQEVAASSSATCALLSGDRVTCWGSNGLGHLGDGTGTDRPHAGDPTLVIGL